MDPKQYQDEADEARERDEHLESLEYDRQEERGVDAWRGLDHD